MSRPQQCNGHRSLVLRFLSVHFVHALILSVGAGYDEEARYFEEGVRGDKRTGLLAALHEAVWPVYETQLTALRARSLTEFKKALKAALADGGEGFTSAASRCGTQCFECRFSATCLIRSSS